MPSERRYTLLQAVSGNEATLFPGGATPPLTILAFTSASRDATVVDMVEVHWPSGAKEKFSIDKVDKIVTIVEGAGSKL